MPKRIARQRKTSPIAWRLAAAIVCAPLGCTLAYELDDLRGAAVEIRDGGVADGTTSDSNVMDGSEDPPEGLDGPGAEHFDGPPDVMDAGSDAHGCGAYPSALFCDDFDGPLQPWSPLLSAFGTVTMVDGGARSPPSSLLAQVSAPDGSTCNYALLQRSLAIATARVRVEQDLLLSTELPIAAGAFTRVSGPDGGGACVYFLEFDLQKKVLTLAAENHAGGPNKTAQVLLSLPQGEWTHVSLAVDGRTAPITLSVAIDGNLIIDGVEAPFECQSGLVQQLGVGLACTGDGDHSLRVDNLALLP
jgi:hypothetical protein